jgi:FAD/FMN-containing dehydrogenase
VLDTSRLARALYSSDASLYRVAPQAVARPRTVEELENVLDAARSAGLPVTTRGAVRPAPATRSGRDSSSTSRRHLNKILSVDPESRTAGSSPGSCQSALQVAAAPYGLRFGPDPSTHNRCTIGGMIGNNACGPRALGYGKTADNVVALQVVTGERERSASARTARGRDSLVGQRLQSLVAAPGHHPPEFGRFGRQVSATACSTCCRRTGSTSRASWPGTRGTLGVITEATVPAGRPDAPHKIMIAARLTRRWLTPATRSPHSCPTRRPRRGL